CSRQPTSSLWFISGKTWCQQDQQLAVLYFRNRDDLPRNQVRMDITKDLISDKTSSVIELYSKGQHLLERVIYFVHLGDWISVELAALRAIDAVEIQVIDHLKRELAKV
ncbi:MAG: SIS domain-containing protein, partial [Bacteroidota bacterium]